MRTKIIGAFLMWLLLVSGGCSATSNTPKTTIIKIQLVGTEQTPYWKPNTAIVAAGGMVTWENTGTDQRYIISEQGLFPDQTVSPGKSFMWTFKNAGTFTFHDDPNIDTNTVIVK